MHSKTLYETKHLTYGIKQYLFATRLTTEVRTLTFLRQQQLFFFFLLKAFTFT